MSPPPPWTCFLRPIPLYFQPLPPMLNPLPSLVGIVPKHSKRQKTGSEDIAAGVAVSLVALYSGNHNLKIILESSIIDYNEVKMYV